MAASLALSGLVASPQLPTSSPFTSSRQSPPSISYASGHHQAGASPLSLFRIASQSQCGTSRSTSHVCTRVLALAAADGASDSGSNGAESGGKSGDSNVVLQSGTAVVIVAEPPFVKSAEPMPMLRRNDGLIRVGDAGRIIDRRPKDSWAIRFGHGAFLLDRKYFEPFEG
ncbi:hypothetical protein CLOM_g8363 [Closterium sp. NIES-68]|nr:hypothetical protein CLOM_g8363 [Closterium sp. NIES-68]GJP77407.1 hypothetical protein CLOP_g7804 [Closterium sp. NIES-67]